MMPRATKLSFSTKKKINNKVLEKLENGVNEEIW